MFLYWFDFIYCFYANITLKTNVYTETGSKAVAACSTIFDGAVFDEILVAVYGAIFCIIYRIFSAAYGGIFVAGNGEFFSAVYGIFITICGGIFARAYKIFSVVCGVIFGVVSARIFIAVDGVSFVAAYEDNIIQLVGERKQVEFCYLKVHMVKVQTHDMLVVHMMEVMVDVYIKDMFDGHKKDVVIKSKRLKVERYVVGSYSGGKLYRESSYERYDGES